MMIRLQLAFLLLLASSLAVTSEEDAPASAPSGYVHPLTNLPAPGEITVNHFFPIHPTKQFPAGAEIKVVVGVHNDATEAYNISAVMGSINSPSDFKLYIQNFTQQVYFEIVEGSGEISLEYTFRPDPALPARDYQVALTVFYEDSKHKFYSTTFFNGTIDITETKKLIDTEILFLYALLAAGFAALVYYAYDMFVDMGIFKRQTKKVQRKPETTKTADDEDEWLKGTNYDPKKKKATATTKKTT